MTPPARPRAPSIGKWAPFRDGLIVWHGNGRRSGQNFEIHGMIASAYQRGGGTASALGFPVSDEYDVPGGRRSDFEGGSIVWARATGAVQVLASGAPNPVLPGVTPGVVQPPVVVSPGINPGAKQLALAGIVKTDPYLNTKRAVVIDDMQAGPMGGYALVRAVDDGSCSPGRGTPDPGVSQRFRYTWKFDRDVTRVAVGQSVIVTFTLDGDQQKCLNQNPFMAVGTEGQFFKSQQSGQRYYFNPAAVSPGSHLGGARRIDINNSGLDTGDFTVGLTGLSGARGMELIFRYNYNVVK